MENLIKINRIGFSQIIQKEIFGDDDLDTKFCECCDSIFPFNNEILLKYIKDILPNNINITANWGNVIKPEKELCSFINTELPYNEQENTNIYNAIYFLKFDPQIQKTLCFADNNLKIGEYKPEAIEGDLFILPANIYRRIPINNSKKNQIILNIVFEKIH
jgi:hypothetical protein